MPNPVPNYAAQLGAVKPLTKSVCLEVCEAARQAGHPIRQVWGYNPNSKPEHSSGLAIDFMTYTDRAALAWVAEYLWTHRKRLRVRWVIADQKIRSTSPGRSGQWERMPDRGSATANHKDHVHVFLADGTYTPPAKPTKPTKISLAALQRAIRGQSNETSHVKLVQGWRGRPVTGRWTKTDTADYAAFQRSLGYAGADADGIPGKASLAKLAAAHGAQVIA